MSILNTNKKKNGGKKPFQTKSSSGLPSAKGKTHSKAAIRNTRLTGGSQRGT